MELVPSLCSLVTSKSEHVGRSLAWAAGGGSVVCAGPGSQDLDSYLVEVSKQKLFSI